ncbi:MAG: putative Ig domain-containing protein [Pseudomonadota bacterium]
MSTRIYSIFSIAFLFPFLGGCLNEESNEPDPTVEVPATNTAPTISGTPLSVIGVSESYAFTPLASDADGDTLTFSITNRPAWATFNDASGELSGITVAASDWTDIQISVSDGTATASLQPFSIRVVEGNIELATSPPLLNQWEQNAVTYGQVWGAALDPSSGNTASQRLDHQYYDAQWVFQQIGEYVGQAEPWASYASYAERVYRDEHLAPNFNVLGYARFPHGLTNDHLNGGDTTLEQVRLMRDSGAFATIPEFQRGNFYDGYCQSMSREMAYLMHANITAERAGIARIVDSGAPRVAHYLRWMEVHFYQWQQGDYRPGDSVCQNFRFAPFMAGLNLHAIMYFYDWEVANGRDPNAFWDGQYWPSVEAMLVDFLTWMRRDARVVSGSLTGESMWIDSTDGATLRYQDRGTTQNTNPAWDLGNLIAPAYTWMALRGLESGMLSRAEAVDLATAGDDLFEGTVNRAAIQIGGKWFNQSYRWSFDYVRWRAELVALLAE